MNFRFAIPTCLTFLLLACSGMSSSGGGSAVGGDSATGGGPVGGGPVGGAPGVGQHAAPGTEEVVLGPGVADPNGYAATMSCEVSCFAPPTSGDTDEGTENGQVVQLKGTVSGKDVDSSLLRIFEYVHEDSSTRYQDLKPDAKGNFTVTFPGKESRTISYMLVKLSNPSPTLNQILPCTNDACNTAGAGDIIELHKVQIGPNCVREINGESLLCLNPNSIHPLLNLK